MSKWKDISHMDDHGVNLIQLFNKETNEMLVVTKECDKFIDFIHLKVTPEYENDELVWIEDCETITRNEYDEDDQYKAYQDLIDILLKD